MTCLSLSEDPHAVALVSETFRVHEARGEKTVCGGSGADEKRDSLLPGSQSQRVHLETACVESPRISKDLVQWQTLGHNWNSGVWFLVVDGSASAIDNVLSTKAGDGTARHPGDGDVLHPSRGQMSISR